MAESDKEIIPRASNEFDPYDSNYPINLLAEGIGTTLAEAEKAAAAIVNAVSKDASIAIQIGESLTKGVRYVVDTPDAMIDSLEKGKIKFTQENNGKMYAQLRQSDGHYGEKVPIKREEFSQGIDPVQMANAMQLRSLQAQVQELQDSITLIDFNVRDVLQGQQNDRFALYQSGLGLFLEARGVSDPDLKRQLTSQAIRALSDASSQISLQLESDVDWLKSESYKEAKGKNKQLILDRIARINRGFEHIHQSYVLRAAIYGDIHEYAAMISTLEAYSHFIDSTIVSNAGFLAECDPDDTGLGHGTWKKRARLSIKMGDLAKQLRSQDVVLYLSEADEDDHEED